MSTRNREFIPNYNCFFVTSSFKNRINILLDDSYYNIIIESLKFCTDKYKCEFIGYVLMPNHIHLILLFNDSPLISGFMRDFKKFTATKIRIRLEEENRKDLLNVLKSEIKTQTFQIWNNRFDLKVIIGSEMLLSKLNYIHNNPIKKELVGNPCDWKYSSANYYFKDEIGVLPITKAHNII